MWKYRCAKVLGEGASELPEAGWSDQRGRFPAWRSQCAERVRNADWFSDGATYEDTKNILHRISNDGKEDHEDVGRLEFEERLARIGREESGNYIRGRRCNRRS